MTGKSILGLGFVYRTTIPAPTQVALKWFQHQRLWLIRLQVWKRPGPEGSPGKGCLVMILQMSCIWVWNCPAWPTSGSSLPECVWTWTKGRFTWGLRPLLLVRCSPVLGCRLVQTWASMFCILDEASPLFRQPLLKLGQLRGSTDGKGISAAGGEGSCLLFWS